VSYYNVPAFGFLVLERDVWCGVSQNGSPLSFCVKCEIMDCVKTTLPAFFQLSAINVFRLISMSPSYHFILQILLRVSSRRSKSGFFPKLEQFFFQFLKMVRFFFFQFSAEVSCEKMARLHLEEVVSN